MNRIKIRIYDKKRVIYELNPEDRRCIKELYKYEMKNSYIL